MCVHVYTGVRVVWMCVNVSVMDVCECGGVDVCMDVCECECYGCV